MDEWNEYEQDDTDVPEEFRDVAQCIDSFAHINYDTALALELSITPEPEDIIHLKGKILDIVRNNPPLSFHSICGMSVRIIFGTAISTMR